MTGCEPEAAVELVHSAEHDVALVDDQVRVEDCPEVIDVGDADKERVGKLPDGGGKIEPPPLQGIPESKASAAITLILWDWLNCL